MSENCSNSNNSAWFTLPWVHLFSVILDPTLWLELPIWMPVYWASNSMANQIQMKTKVASTWQGTVRRKYQLLHFSKSHLLGKEKQAPKRLTSLFKSYPNRLVNWTKSTAITLRETKEKVALWNSVQLSVIKFNNDNDDITFSYYNIWLLISF